MHTLTPREVERAVRYSSDRLKRIEKHIAICADRHMLRVLYKAWWVEVHEIHNQVVVQIQKQTERQKEADRAK